MVVLMKNNDVSRSFTPANNESIDMWYLPLWPLDGTVRPVDLTSAPCQIVVFLTSLPNRKFTRCCRRAGTPRDRLSRGSSSTRPCSTSRPAPCSSSPQPGPRAQSNLVITELCAGGRGREGGCPRCPSQLPTTEAAEVIFVWIFCTYVDRFCSSSTIHSAYKLVHPAVSLSLSLFSPPSAVRYVSAKQCCRAYC